MRGTVARLSHDDGMTIVEVVVAVTILFIVLTGILGLITQNLNASMQAKQEAVFTNAVNSYVERVQAMPFEKVFVGTGGLESSETTQVGEYVIVLEPTVTPGPGGVPSLRTLTVTATITGPNGVARSMTTDVVVRNKESYITQAAKGPDVTWTVAVMPAQSEAVYGQFRTANTAVTTDDGALYIAMTAVAAADRVITRITVRADNGWPLRSATGAHEPLEIEWDPADGPQTYTLSSFVWNTLQEEMTNDDPVTMTRVMQDGVRTITLKVRDSAGAETTRTYMLLLDNHAPDQPAGLRYAVTAGGPALVWDSTSDGDMTVTTFRVGLRQQATTGVWPAFADASATGESYSVSPFSRYLGRVTAIGPPPLSRESTPTVMTESFITPPKATGTQKKNTLTLTVGAPTFKVTGLTYQWQSSTSTAGPWANISGATASTYTGTRTIGAYYRCVVGFTPGADYTGTASPTVVGLASSVVGPGLDLNGNTTVPLGEVWIP